MDGNASDALRTLDVLVGEWETVAPAMEAEGRTTFEWLDGGGFLIERSVVQPSRVPQLGQPHRRDRSGRWPAAALLRLARRGARVRDDLCGWNLDAIPRGT